MEDKKKGPGRPSTLTAETRREQLRKAKADQRARDKEAGMVELKATVHTTTKAWFIAYQEQHGLKTLGDALEKIKSKMNVDASA